MEQVAEPLRPFVPFGDKVLQPDLVEETQAISTPEKKPWTTREQRVSKRKYFQESDITLYPV